MTFMDKLRKVAELSQSDETVSLLADFPSAGMPKELLDALKEDCEFLPSDYMMMLAEFDGLDLYGVTFFGSSEGQFKSIDWLLGLAGKQLNTETCRALAKDADGTLVYTKLDGGIYWSLDESEEKLADSFADFMGGVLMGKDYQRINPDGVAYDEDEWAQFLISQGWL